MIVGAGNALHAPIQVCSTDPAERRSEYEHLVPLHATHAALPKATRIASGCGPN
jgi:hypothetical protein